MTYSSNKKFFGHKNLEFHGSSMKIKTQKFFHTKASQWRRRNHIQSTKNFDDCWVEEVDDIAKVANDYFANLFIAGTCSQIDDCLSAVPHKITPNMQQILTNDFTADEIKAALFQMRPIKAPRPDGMNALFYQKFWHVVGDNVIIVVLDYLNFGCMTLGINHTNIVLIPKVKNPDKMPDFRPISLYNVIYKIISKVLANRFKQIFPHVISPTQSAFVPNKLITDNVLLAYETLHAMHSWKKGRKLFGSKTGCQQGI